MTSMPPVADQVSTARNVPRAARPSAGGSARNTTKACRRPDPGMAERRPMAMGANSA